MDAFILTRSLDRREKYVNPAIKLEPIILLQFVLSLAISTYAAYLAWNAGSADHMFFRFFMTFAAFMLSTLYIIVYVVVKSMKK